MKTWMHTAARTPRLAPWIAAAALLIPAAIAPALTGGVLLLSGSASALADDATLAVGSVAPPLSDVTWLQGEPVPAWQEGQIYVLDFWATWCGPCRESIPHLNALSQALEGKGVHVIGVAIWPRKGMVPTADFVKQKGAAMGYGIAEDIGGKTASAYMTAAGRNGIPTVMVVDGTGKIAWINHPMKGLTEELGRLVPGFDAVNFDKQRLEREAKYNTLVTTMKAAEKAADWKGFAEASVKVAELDPSRNGVFLIYGYQALLKLDDKSAAHDFGRTAVAGSIKDEVEPLNLFAWSIVDPDVETPMAERDLELANLAVARADTLSGHKDPSVLDTLARLQFLGGAVQEAIATQRLALELTADAELKQDLQTRLDDYMKAAPKG